jgi:CHAT domain-containing protein/tetratricopeptide (TPR) repeat protein
MVEKELVHRIREAFKQMDEGLNHPSAAQLAEMLGGELSEVRRREIEQHLETCQACRETLDDYRQFLADCQRPAARDVSQEYSDLRQRIKWRKASSSGPRWFAIAAGVIVVLGLSYAGYRILAPSPDRLLAQAYADQRSFEFRLAGAAYAPVRQERGDKTAFGLPAPLLKAQANIAEALRSRPEDPELLRFEGEAEMIARDASAAVRSLERSRDLKPRDSRILADLGAAYALRAQLEHQPADLGMALDQLSRSLQLRPDDPETLFNRALVLEQMLQKDQAAAEWEKYLKVDGTSAWAGEARKHLADLRAEMKARENALAEVVGDPHRFLDRVRSGRAIDPEAYLIGFAVTDWLPRLEADETVRRAVSVLDGLLQARGDRWLADVTGSAGAGRLPGLVKLAAARAANQGGRPQQAIAAARDAQQLLQRAGNPAGVLWARFEEVVGERSLLRSDECLAAAGRLANDLQAHSYVWLRAQTLIESATCGMRTGRLTDAAGLLLMARETSQAAGFRDAALRAGIIYLDCVGHVGLQSEFFAGAQQSLRTFWQGAYKSDRLYQIVDRMREAAGRSDQIYTALFLARSDVWAATDRLNVAPAHANLAAAAQVAGEVGEARANLAISDRLYAGLPEGYRLRPQIFLSNVDLQRGDVDAALNRLNALHVDVDPPPLVLYVSQYYLALGEAYRRKHMLTEAIGAFRKSIDLGTRRILSLSDEREKAGLLEAVNHSYRGLVAGTLEKSNYAAALSPEYASEGWRIWQAFLALDAVGVPGRVHDVETPTLTFVELPSGFVSWLVVRNQVTLHRFDVAKDSLAAVVGRFRRECSDPALAGEQLRNDARQLYQWMIGPFDALLRESDRELTLELDGVLTGVPVQALISRDGRYLGERYSIMVASGYATAPRAVPPRRDARLLVVANPSVKGGSAGRFPPLPDSPIEIAAVRAAFPATSILEGDKATLEALAAALPDTRVVHFLGHGYANSDDGALIFAPGVGSGGEYGLLRSADLRRQDWSGCSLAVLSACAAAAGETRGAHNPDSLVRALTKAGVARVAASLWNSDSGATAELMGAFYRSLAAGLGYSQALRSAQQQVRQRREWSHPYYWAGFQLYGAS